MAFLHNTSFIFRSPKDSWNSSGKISSNQLLNKLLLGSNSYAFSNHILSHLWPLAYSLAGRHISYSLFKPITFAIVHICISLQNTNIHEVLRDNHKYFTLVSHICSFTSMIPWVFLVWWSYLCFSNIYAVLLQFINILHLAAISQICISFPYLHL